MYNETLSTKRQVVASGKSSLGSYVLEDQECYIEQPDPDILEGFDDSNAYESMLCIIPGVVDVPINDVAYDSGGNTYTVAGVQFFSNTEIPDHTELALRKIL